jgi:hypothetical protein
VSRKEIPRLRLIRQVISSSSLGRTLPPVSEVNELFSTYSSAPVPISFSRFLSLRLLNAKRVTFAVGSSNYGDWENITPTARVVGLGSPKSGVTVSFAVMQGTGSLSAASAVTNSSGYASVGLTLTNFISAVQVSACVAPGNNPCQTIAGNPVAASMVNLQAVGGGGQLVTGLGLQPMLVRATNFSTPPNGVLGETVLFQSTVMRPVENGLTQTTGDLSATAIILSESQIYVQSDVNGLATFVPSIGSFTGPSEIEIQVSAGATATLQGQMEIFPSGTGGSASAAASGPWHRSAPALREVWREPGIEDPRIEDRRIDDR